MCVCSQDAMVQWCEHMALMAPLECFVPKHHRMFHLVFNMKYQGNPGHYSTWTDEGLSKTLKAACKHASQLSFERSVLFRMRSLLAAPPPRKRGR